MAKFSDGFRGIEFSSVTELLLWLLVPPFLLGAWIGKRVADRYQHLDDDDPAVDAAVGNALAAVAWLIKSLLMVPAGVVGA
jgi:hypothetical protein